MAVGGDLRADAGNEIHLQDESTAIRLLAESDDVKIGRAMNSCGTDVAPDRIFAEIRLCLLAEESELAKVKEETLDPLTLPVDALRFTQHGCSGKFKCGRSVSETIKLFVQGLQPTTQSWCILDVIRRNGLLLSNANRRLYAMKEAQRQLRENDPAAVIWVHVRIHTWVAAFDTFLQHCDHACTDADGKCIKLRLSESEWRF